MRRFSKNDLFELRNQIPIQQLMEDLQVPFINENNTFRFLCPICKGYNTSIKYDKNLGRCFNCNENFNTIDIAIKIRTTDFVDNIKYLKRYLSDHKASSVKNPSQKATIKSQNNKQICHNGFKIHKQNRHRVKNLYPVRLSEVVENIMKPGQDNNSCVEFNWSDYCRSTDKRLSIIEKQFELIFHQLDKLRNSQNNK